MRRKNKEDSPPGPPPRPKRKRLPIFMTVWQETGDPYDCWVEEPDGVGVEVPVPWDDKVHHFNIGRGEGAYDIGFDRRHMCPRVSVYDNFPNAPMMLEKGNWKAKEPGTLKFEDRVFEKQIGIKVAAEAARKSGGIPREWWFFLAFAFLTSAVAIASMVMG